MPSQTTRKKQKMQPFIVRAIKDYDGDAKSLNLMKMCYYQITKKDTSGWWYAISTLGDMGWIPAAYVRRISDSEVPVESEFWKKPTKRSSPGKRGNEIVSSTPRNMFGQTQITPGRRVRVTKRQTPRNDHERKMKYNEGMDAAVELIGEIDGVESDRIQVAGHRGTPKRPKRPITPKLNVDLKGKSGEEKCDFLLEEVEDKENPRWNVVLAALDQLLPDIKENPDVRDYFLDSNGFDAVLTVLESHCGHEQAEIQEKHEYLCVYSLNRLASGDLKNSLFGEVNPFPILLNHLQERPNDSTSIVSCFYVLTQVAALPHYRKLLAKTPDLMDTVVQYLKQNVDVQANAMAILGSVSRDQQQLFEERHFKALFDVIGRSDNSKIIRNVLSVLCNLSTMDILVGTMSQAGIFPVLEGLLDHRDRKVRENVSRVIKNMFRSWRNTDNLCLDEIYGLFRDLFDLDQHRKLCISCMMAYAKNCANKLANFDALLTTRCLDPFVLNSQPDEILNMLKILWHFCYHCKEKKHKSVFFEKLLKSGVLHSLFMSEYAGKEEVSIILKTLCFLVANPNGGKVLGRHHVFLAEIIQKTSLKPDKGGHHRTLRLCFEVAREKRHHRHLLEAGVLEFCQVLTASHHKKTIELFLGLILRLGMKGSSPEVKLGLLDAEVKLRAFLNSIKDIGGMEQAVKVAQRTLSVVKKTDPQLLHGVSDYDDGSSDSDSFEDEKRVYSSSHPAKSALQTPSSHNMSMPYSMYDAPILSTYSADSAMANSIMSPINHGFEEPSQKLILNQTNSIPPSNSMHSFSDSPRGMDFARDSQQKPLPTSPKRRHSGKPAPPAGKKDPVSDKRRQPTPGPPPQRPERKQQKLRLEETESHSTEHSPSPPPSTLTPRTRPPEDTPRTAPPVVQPPQRLSTTEAPDNHENFDDDLNAMQAEFDDDYNDNFDAAFEMEEDEDNDELMNLFELEEEFDLVKGLQDHISQEKNLLASIFSGLEKQYGL